MALLGVLFYVFTFGSTDAGEPIAQAVAIAAVVSYRLAKTGPGPRASGEDARRQEARRPYVAAMLGRRSAQLDARS